MRWAMYANGISPPSSRVATVELRITDSTGKVHVVNPASLYAGVGNPNSIGGSVTRRTFSDDVIRQETYRLHLIERLQQVYTELNIVDIAGWELTWTDVDPFVVPNFDRSQPDIERLLGEFNIQAYYQRLAPPDMNPDFRFDDTIDFLAYSLPDGNTVAQCDTLYIRTWWQAVEIPSIIYIGSVTIADSQGNGRAQDDHPLANTDTFTWDVGFSTYDRHLLDIPCDLPTGDYTLLLALYELVNLAENRVDFDGIRNALVTNMNGEPIGDFLYLTTITITEADNNGNSE